MLSRRLAAGEGGVLLLEDLRDLWLWAVDPKGSSPGRWIEDVAAMDGASILAAL
jgi:hypothetical protein